MGLIGRGKRLGLLYLQLLVIRHDGAFARLGAKDLNATLFAAITPSKYQSQENVLQI